MTFRATSQEEGRRARVATPTFVAMRLTSALALGRRSFYIRLREADAKRATEIAVHFQPLPHSLFGEGATSRTC